MGRDGGRDPAGHPADGRAGGRARSDSERDVDLTVLDRLGRPVHASRLFHSGEHPTLRVRTAAGFDLTGTHNHPVLCLVDALGVPLLFWKRLDELRAGDRVLVSRAPRESDGALTPAESAEAGLLGAFVSKGWVGERRAGFNNVDPEFFVECSPRRLDRWRRRYVSRRRIASGSWRQEIDVHNLTALRASPLACLVGCAAVEKRIRSACGAPRPPTNARSCRRSSRATARARASRGRPSRSRTRPTASDWRGKSSCCYSSSASWVGCAGHPLAVSQVVLTNRREARLFAERIGFLGAKQEKLGALLERIPLTSRALSHDHVPHVASYIRGEAGGGWTDRDWLRRHNVDRVERWERDGTAIMERIASSEVRSVVKPLVDGRLLLRRGGGRGARGRRAGLLAAGRYRRPLVPHQRLRQPQHRSAFVANRHGDAPRPRRRHRRLRAQLRRLGAGAARAARLASPTCWSTARPGSPWAWPRTSRRTTCARRSPPRSRFIDDPEIDVEGLMRHVKGPDFPTGGIILGSAGIRDAYASGRGRVRVQARAHVEPLRQGKEAIIVTELPYASQEGRRRRPDPEDRRPGARQEDQRDLRPARRVRQAGHARRHRAQARRHPQGRAQQALQAHAAADHVRREHGRAGRRGAAHAVAARGDRRLRTHQREVVVRRTKFELARAGAPRAHPRGPARGARQPRRGDRHHPRLARRQESGARWSPTSS